MLRIVHFSVTRMAGGPYRLVQALRRYTPHDVRLVDLQAWDEYPQDIAFENSQQEACELAEQADIIHFHNYLDLDSTSFHPIDFRALHARGTRIIRQFRSEPGLIARRMQVPIDRVRQCRLPAVVIAQFQERYYPHARVVPNNIPLDDSAYIALSDAPRHDVVFCPTNNAPAGAHRWNTKGYPETQAMLNRLSKRGCSSVIISGQPMHVALEAKRRSRIVLDELVTGSYHVSALEGTAMQKPTLAFLDPRCQQVLREVTGSTAHPFVNVRLQEAEAVLRYLLDHEEEAREIGLAARQWMDSFWSESSIAGTFDEVYQQLMADPSRVQRQTALRLDRSAQRFFAVTLPNLTYQSQHRRPDTALSHRTLEKSSRRVQKLWAIGRRFASRTSRLMRRHLT